MKRLYNPMRWHWIVAVLAIPLLALVLNFTVSERAGAIVILFWPLWLALRFDNWTGSFFLLTILLYVVFGIVAMLLAAAVALSS